MAAKEIVSGGLLIAAETMSGDFTYANGKSKLMRTGRTGKIGLHCKSAGTPDHVGVIKIRAMNSADDAGTCLAVPQLTVATGTLVDAILELQVNAKYIEVWYDRTSGGASDTLTVTAIAMRA